MLKKIAQMLKYIGLGLIGVIALLGITFLIKPNVIQNLAMKLFFPKVKISDKYINKIVVENPEVYELLHIASGLTPTCQADANLLHKKTDYYKDVEAHFSAYSDHELVKAIESQLKKNDFIFVLGAIRTLSINYDVNEDNEIIHNKTISISKLLLKAFKNKAFLVPNHLELIQDFAQKTNFKAFYKTHQATYEGLAEEYNKLCDFADMQAWLEQKFPNKAESYRIVFSPLTGGFHNTMSFEDKKRNASQNFMFVNAPRVKTDTLSEKELEIYSSRSARIVFTEIDHNYVNPMTDKYLEELAIAMPNHKDWNEEKQGYKSTYNTFNEYMTWGVFSLYALDTYGDENIEEIIKIQADFMDDFRGFNRFSDFNDELMRLYETNNKPPINELYPPMLEWVGEQIP